MSADHSDVPLSPDADIHAQAAGWLAKRDRGFSTEDAAAFQRWLASDPRYQIAVAELEAAWSSLDELAALRPAAGAGEIDPDLLAPPKLSAPGARASRSNRRWWQPALAIAASVAILISAWVARRSLRSDAARPDAIYETQVAEQRKITLPDGSTLELNTNSAVETHFTAKRRSIRLKRGEVYFAVAKDASRPFVVETEAIAVRAVGTAFDVYRRGAQTEVTVTEGVVHLDEPGRDQGASTVTAGQRAIVESNADQTKIRLQTLNAEDANRLLAWRDGELIFENAPLSTVVAEFNRYNARQLEIADPELAGISIGGRFKIHELDAFVRQLATTFNIATDRREPNTLLLHRASP